MTVRIAAIAVVLLGCEATGGGGGSSAGAVKITESGTQRGSAGGFSATLGQELGPAEGSLGAAAPGAQVASGAASGSASGSAASGGSVTMTVTGSAAPAAAPSGSAAAGSAAPAPSGSAAPVAVAVASGSAAAAPPRAGSAAPAAAGSAAPMPAAGSAAPAKPAVAEALPAAPKGKRVYVKPSADVAAIKLELEPNWERDVGEAGTFSLVVKVPSTEDTRVFAVRYGYDNQAAPVDCDQYRKFLEDSKAMTPTMNRQRSGACYVESATAFRYMINYGGKRLMCQGSLYKDAASAALGDLRDKVLMQAKKICETLAL